MNLILVIRFPLGYVFLEKSLSDFNKALMADNRDNLLRCIITIDTECPAEGMPTSMNAHPLGYDTMMLGKTGTKEYDIRHIMNIMERYSLATDFFVEPLRSYKLGISQLKVICQMLISRGHGASLDLHPLRKLEHNPDLLRFSDNIFILFLSKKLFTIKKSSIILAH